MSLFSSLNPFSHLLSHMQALTIATSLREGAMVSELTAGEQAVAEVTLVESARDDQGRVRLSFRGEAPLLGGAPVAVTLLLDEATVEHIHSLGLED